ncbi:MAG: extracellular solute-binding protein [Anaerolineaceae bacterium]|nr:extracellular solute-binding protein [Anaerolineaceae bacterium]
MKKFKLFTLISLLVVVSMLLAACTPKTPEATEEVTTAEVTQEVATEEATAEVTDATPPEEVTLTIQHWQPSLVVENAPWWGEILAGFEAEHPGVTVVNNFVPFADYLTTLETQLAGDQLVDVFYGHVKAAEIGKAGKSLDLRTVFDQEFFDSFYSGPLSQFDFPNAEGGTNVYALPMDAQLFGLFVNPAIMTELGLEAPETWDDLMAMAPTIVDAGYVPLAWGNQAKNVAVDFILPIIQQYGGNVLGMDLSGEGWDGEATINAFQLLADLVDAGVLVEGINAVSEEQGRELAFQGRAAMLYGPNSNIGVISNDAPEEFASTYVIEKVPALTAGGKHWTGDGSGNGWVVAKGDNQDLAVEFLKYFYSDAVYDKFITNTKRMPSNSTSLDAVENKNVQLMASWLDDGADHILFGQGTWDAVANACQSVLDGSLTPEEAAKQVQADIDATRGR